MTSQAYNDNDGLLFLLQIWKTGTLCSSDCVSSPLILVEKSVVETLSFGNSNLANFLLNSLFYTWIFIKSEFLHM